MKTNSPLYFAFISLVIGASLMASCKTRKVQIEVNDQVKPTVEATGEQIRVDQADFGWFDGKFNAEVNNNGKTNSLKGRVRMRQDSLIWISIKPDVAIIEVFRLLISKDSIQLIDYLNKQYYKGEFSSISQIVQYDVNYKMLEGLFVGNPHFMLPLRDYQVSVSGTDTILSSTQMNTYLEARKAANKANFLFQALWINSRHRMWRNLLYDPKNRIEMDVQYPQFQTIDSTEFPLEAQITVVGDTVNTQFHFTYTKTVLNQPFDFPFTIPDSYSPMQIKQR